MTPTRQEFELAAAFAGVEITGVDVYIVQEGVFGKVKRHWQPDLVTGDAFRLLSLVLAWLLSFKRIGAATALQARIDDFWIAAKTPDNAEQLATATFNLAVEIQRSRS